MGPTQQVTIGIPNRSTCQPRTQDAGRGGCWTCRVRRKKCDEQREGDSCKTCKRLTLKCLGWGAERPDWMRNKKNVDEYKASIKAQLSQPRHAIQAHTQKTLPQRPTSSRTRNGSSNGIKFESLAGTSHSSFGQLPAFGDGFDHTVNYPQLPTLPSFPFSYPSLIDPLDDPSFSPFTSSTNHHSGFSESPSPSLAPPGQTAVYDKLFMQHGLAIGDGSGDQIGDRREKDGIAEGREEDGIGDVEWSRRLCGKHRLEKGDLISSTRATYTNADTTDPDNLCPRRVQHKPSTRQEKFSTPCEQLGYTEDLEEAIPYNCTGHSFTNPAMAVHRPSEHSDDLEKKRKLKALKKLRQRRMIAFSASNFQPQTSSFSDNQDNFTQALPPEKINGTTSHRGPGVNSSNDYDISNTIWTNASPDIVVEELNQCAERKFLVSTKWGKAGETTRGALDDLDLGRDMEGGAGRHGCRTENEYFKTENEDVNEGVVMQLALTGSDFDFGAIEEEASMDISVKTMVPQPSFRGKEKKISAYHYVQSKLPDRCVVTSNDTSGETDKETETSQLRHTRHPFPPLPPREHHSMASDEVTSLIAVRKWRDCAFEEKKMQPTMCAYLPPLTRPTRNLFEQDGCSSPLTTESPTTDISAKAVTNRTTDYHDSTDPSCLDPSVISTSRYIFEADGAQRLNSTMDINVVNVSKLLTQTQYALQDTNEGNAQSIPDTIDRRCDSTLEISATIPGRDIIDTLDSLVPFDGLVSTQDIVSRSILEFGQNFAPVKKTSNKIHSASIEDSVVKDSQGEFNTPYSIIQTAHVWLLVGRGNLELNDIVCVMTGWYRWSATASSSFLTSDDISSYSSFLSVEESLFQNFNDADGTNQNSHNDNFRPIHITYNIQNCQSVNINSQNSKGNKFTNSGNNAPKIINHGCPTIDPNINDDSSTPSATEGDEDTESPHALCSESCPREGVPSKPIVVPLDGHYQRWGFPPPPMGQLGYVYPQPIAVPLDAYQQWGGLPSPFMGQPGYVYPQSGFSPSFPPGFPTLPLQNHAQFQNQFIAVPPGYTLPLMPEEEQMSQKSENSHRSECATQQCVPGMASGASPSSMGNAFQNARGSPQQYPMSPFSLSQVQRFQTGVQNTSPCDVSNNCTENNVVSNANHHTAANESRHHVLPQSDPLRDDKVKHLEHLLESALEMARLIQADETISESDVLSARGHTDTVFKSLQSLLQSPVRRDLNSRPKPQRRLFNWSQIQMRIQRVTGKEAKEPSSTNCI